MAEDSRELKRDGFGCRGVGHNQIGERIERIEEKVRVDLRPKRTKCRLSHLLFQQRFTLLPLGHVALEPERIEAGPALRSDDAEVVDFVRDEPATTGLR